MFRRALWVMLFAALLVSVCATAYAKGYAITVSSGDFPEAGALNARVSNEKYKLYLPGTWDPKNVTITVSGQESFYIGDTLITSGQPCDVSGLIGKEQPMKRGSNGKKFATITIYHGSRIPSVFFTMDAKTFSKVYRDKFIDVNDGHITFVEADGSIPYDGAMASFHGRGNATYGFAKKPFQFKLDKKMSLAGLAKGKTWILLANYQDLSLLRNQITLDLAREVGIPYAIGSQPIDVYVNGDYYGLYLLTEKVQIGKSRIDITNLEKATEALNDKPLTEYKRFSTSSKEFPIYKGYEIPNDPEDITGGYIFEIEKRYRLQTVEYNGFETDLSLRFVIKEPTAASRRQLEYASNLLQDFHYAVHAKDGHSPQTGKYYMDFIDLPSFSAKYLVEEFVKNYDALASSQFLFKDSDLVDGKLYFGPVWDFDLCMGNIQLNGFVSGSKPEKEYLAVTHTRNDNLYYLLSQHEDFMSAVRQDFWDRLVPAAQILLGQREAPEGCALKTFDEYAAAIEASSAMNFSRWPAGSIHGFYSASGKTHEKSLAYLKDFITRRLAFMMQNWPKQ